MRAQPRRKAGRAYYDTVSLFGEYRFSQSEAADLSLDGVSAHQHFADHGILAGLTYHMGD